MSNTFICILPQASMSSMNFNAVYIEKGLLQVAKFRYAQEARFHFSYFIFFFLLPCIIFFFLPGIHDNNKWNDMCGEKDTEKNLSSRRELNPRPSVH